MSSETSLACKSSDSKRLDLVVVLDVQDYPGSFLFQCFLCTYGAADFKSPQDQKFSFCLDLGNLCTWEYK